MNSSLNGTLFSFRAILHRIVIVAFLIAGYFWIVSKGLFPNLQNQIELGVKILIAYQILAGSTRSLMAPMLACAAGFGMLAYCSMYDFAGPLVSTTNSWQLIIVWLLGLLITVSKL